MSCTENIVYLAGGTLCAAKLDSHMCVCSGITIFPLVCAQRISANDIVALSGSSGSVVSELGLLVAGALHIVCSG